MISYTDDKKLKEFYESLVRLAQNDDFQRYVGWMVDSLQENRAKNDSLQDIPGKPILSWNQGEINNLKTQLSVISDCINVFKKLQEPKQEGVNVAP